jgi:phosphatidylserine decarboxylase
MTIHKEGYRTIYIIVIFLAFINLTLYRLSPIIPLNVSILIISIVFFLLILYFFRDPHRTLEERDNSLFYSPADGKVVVIENTIEKEYFKDERLMISVFMSPLNVHINFHPVSGKITFKKHHPGKYLVAWHPKSSEENERTTIVYNTGKEEILVRQIAGAVARRIVNYPNTGEEVSQGTEMGFIKFGSRVDIFLPVGTECKVKIGQKVRSAIDVLASL